MLVKTSVIRDCEVVGEDATFGKVTDLYFDQFGWRSCYVVIETGELLAGKRSLVPVSYVDKADWQARRITLRITKQGLEHVGCEDLDHNVARQLEEHHAGYVAWPPLKPKPEGSTSQVPLGDAAHPGTDDEGKPLLRSAKEICGYAVEATDGPCGHVDDLLIDDKTWNVEFVLINPRNFLPGTARTVPAPWVKQPDWLAHCVRMNVGKSRIRDCAPYETNPTIDHLLNSTV